MVVKAFGGFMDRAARCGALSALSTSESDRMSGIPPRLPFSVGCGWAVMRATGRKHGMEEKRSGWFQGMRLEFSRIAIAREGKA